MYLFAMCWVSVTTGFSRPDLNGLTNLTEVFVYQPTKSVQGRSTGLNEWEVASEILNRVDTWCRAHQQGEFWFQSVQQLIQLGDCVLCGMTLVASNAIEETSEWIWVITISLVSEELSLGGSHGICAPFIDPLSPMPIGESSMG